MTLNTSQNTQGRPVLCYQSGTWVVSGTINSLSSGTQDVRLVNNGTIIVGNTSSNSGTVAIGNTVNVKVTDAINDSGTIAITGAPASATTAGTMINYTTSASTLLASSETRRYAIMRNFSTSTMYMGFGRVASTVNADLYLNQYDAYELSSINLFTGNINIIGTGSGTVSILAW